MIRVRGARVTSYERDQHPSGVRVALHAELDPPRHPRACFLASDAVVGRTDPLPHETPHPHCLICAGLVLFIVLSYPPDFSVAYWVSTN